MSEREFVEETSRVLDAPRDVVWALVSDTNRFDRAAGLSAGKYSFRQLDPKDPSSRQRVATASQLGFSITWVEPPYEWVEGASVRGERKFIEGPVSRGGFQVSLEDAPGGKTLVKARLFIAAESVAGKLGAVVARWQMRTGTQRLLDSIERALSDAKPRLAESAPNEPAGQRVRRALQGVASDPISAGPTSAVDEENLSHRLRRFDTAPVEPSLRARMISLLRTRPDDELATIRPFELAGAWGADRRDVLRGFLYASKAGLFDLRWQLNCPTCKVGADNAASLGDIARKAHCGTCNIDFELDFAAHVEAVFTPSPSVRRVETVLYCASSPWFRPHIFAQVALEKGASRSVLMTVPRASVLFRTLEGKRRVTVEFDEGAPERLELTLRADAIDVTRSGKAKEGAETQVLIHNESGSSQYVLTERAGWSADIVLGSAIASLPEFLDLFATEAPAAGIELKVSSLTVLFSDLTGSTAMYESLGDARAFAMVQEHFTLMGDAIGKHGGAVVKTMGDAVMATFESPAAAMRACVEMVERSIATHGEAGLSVKLGIHEGPCLAVRANERLDYFGTTVNVAARLQAQAHANEIVLTRELSEHPGVKAALETHRMQARPFEASLKGIKEVQKLYAYTLPVALSSDAPIAPAVESAREPATVASE